MSEFQDKNFRRVANVTTDDMTNLWSGYFAGRADKGDVDLNNLPMIDSERAAPGYSQAELIEFLGLVDKYLNPAVIALDMGASVGRLTGPLLERTAYVVAMDIDEGALAENRRIHGESKASYITASAIDFELPAWVVNRGGVNFAVSCWLMSYLPNQEHVNSYLSHLHQALASQGVAFLRESCERVELPENYGRDFDPIRAHTTYRPEAFYLDAFNKHNLTVLESGSMQASLKFLNENNQKYWIVQKKD